jgi:hypothetical protein
MTYQLRLPLLAVVLFCLTSMAGCPNNVPAGQYTVVKGTVTNLRTGRPMPGVLMTIGTDNRGSGSYYDEGDSVRTDLQGNYTLIFTNAPELYYGICCEGANDNRRIYRLDLPDSIIPSSNPHSWRRMPIVIGSPNTINFRPSPCRVFAVKVATRVTGYQRLEFNRLQKLPADNQTRTVYLYVSVPFRTGFPQFFYQKPSVPPFVEFSRTLPNGVTQDTLIQVKTSTPLTGDTVQASLQFGK